MIGLDILYYSTLKNMMLFTKGLDILFKKKETWKERARYCLLMIVK